MLAAIQPNDSLITHVLMQLAVFVIAIGVFLFPIFMSHGGLRLAQGVAALVSLLGLAVTFFMLPETKGRSLEELSAT